MDHRDRLAMYGRCEPEHQLDLRHMTLTFEHETEDGDPIEFVLPVRMQVCDTCGGKGTHVNPSIDSHGITAEEWSEWDDEEREGYFSGHYDITCYRCSGTNVTPEIDRERAAVDALKAWDEECKSLADDRRCQESERRYGA